MGKLIYICLFIFNTGFYQLNMNDLFKDSFKKQVNTSYSTFGNIKVIFAIIVLGILIVWGINKIITVDRTHRDLIRDLQSRSFGNKWVVAYELSKYISGNKIPVNDMPWVIENLVSLYESSKDERTRDFIIVALGGLRTKLTFSFLIKALDDPSDKVKLHALIALGNNNENDDTKWDKVLLFLDNEDIGLRQSAIFVLSTHKISNAETRIVELLSDNNIGVRYAAATGLIYYRNMQSIPILKEILKLNSFPKKDFIFSREKVIALKLNILFAFQKEKWNPIKDFIISLGPSEKNMKVLTEIKKLH